MMHILLVEKDGEISTRIKHGLEAQGSVVDVACCTSEALDWAETVVFDLVIFNIAPTELDDLRIYRDFQKKGQPVPVLVMKGENKIGDSEVRLDTGPEDDLVKFVTVNELLTRFARNHATL